MCRSDKYVCVFRIVAWVSFGYPCVCMRNWVYLMHWQMFDLAHTHTHSQLASPEHSLMFMLMLILVRSEQRLVHSVCSHNVVPALLHLSALCASWQIDVWPLRAFEWSYERAISLALFIFLDLAHKLVNQMQQLNNNANILLTPQFAAPGACATT